MKNKIAILLLMFLSSANCIGQNRNAIWCFGDSSGIDFTNIQNPIPIATGMDARGSCTSIADTSGNLLFYASTSDPLLLIPNELVYVRNALNQVMTNGDSIVGLNWYQELTITQDPANSNLYYLFSVGVTNSFGLYYSIVDMNLNGGLGGVVQKNVQLENFKVVDCLKAIKHGNGRDWWIIIRNALNFSNEHYLYLISPSGISSSFTQAVGSVNNTNGGRYCFSADGSKLAYINLIGLMEIYDFDRCTGVISNPVTIHPEPTTAPYGWFVSCEFSLNGRFLYVTVSNTTNYLYQYDLLSPNPATSRIAIDSTSNYLIGSGFVKQGPDNKIYFSTAYECDAFPYCYPYPDSVYNQYNMNLSVINSPDSFGLACNYAPYSFYLGGKRTYYGLPNNPDYDMPALAGSPCDTLVSISEPASINTNANLHVYYASDWEKAFINAEKLKGKQYWLRMVDVLGKEVYSESGSLDSQYFTRDLNCASFTKGMYIVVFETEKEKLTKQFVIE